MNICCLYENQCIVDFGNGQRFFENSSNGREQLRSACDKNNACAIYDEVLTVWGANPTVEDEPELTFAELKTQKKAEIAAARYEREIAGVEVNGVLHLPDVDAGGAEIGVFVDDGAQIA